MQSYSMLLCGLFLFKIEIMSQPKNCEKCKAELYKDNQGNQICFICNLQF